MSDGIGRTPDVVLGLDKRPPLLS